MFLTFVRWPGQFAANVTLTGIVSHEDSKIGTFSDALMTEANKSGWTVVSMKDDWKTIYPPAETGKPAP